MKACQLFWRFATDCEEKSDKLVCTQYDMYETMFVLTGLLVSFHSAIQGALLPQLSSPRMAVRKRAIIALGMYSLYLYSTYMLFFRNLLYL